MPSSTPRPSPVATLDPRVAERIDRIVDYLVEQLSPRRIILFGSRAKGVARIGSDIDVAIEGVPPPDLRRQRRLREDLDRLGGLYSVDLVFLDDAESPFRSLVHESGITLHEQQS